MQIARMNPKKNPPSPADLVVATAHTARGLRQARNLQRGEVGFVEVRLDAPELSRARLAETLPGIRPRLLLTARHPAHPAEGGAQRFPVAVRRSLLVEFLSQADAVDVELRSAASMASLLEEAHRRRIQRVISFHDFRRTPRLPRLREVVRRATARGADVVKIATLLRGPGDLAVLLLLQSTAKVPLATMGMGPLGKVSRLVLAAAGSRLNYGYLDKAQVSGQWAALELVRRLGEIMS
jgi:3-dehydroquinate dehydratase-1